MFTKNAGVCVRRRGFTMVELIAVLAMLAVLAAAAIPAIAGFIEHGKQINRNNIARTLYLAVQSELVKMKSEGRLIDELADPYFTPNPNGNGYELNTDSAAMGRNNVWTELGITNAGGLPEGEEAENLNSVHYISKPRGTFSTTGATELDAFCRLLDRVVLDKSILNNAILMEYNVETGVVLSIFYGDTEAFADGGEFDYLTDPDSIYNVSGNRGYEFAEHRKQGYYGANGTGDLLPPPDMMPQTEIFDGAFQPIPDLIDSDGFTSEISGMENVLYVEAYLPKPTDENASTDLTKYTLSLVPVNGSAEITVGTLGSLNSMPGLRVHGPFASARTIVQHGITINSDAYELYIIILDHVDGSEANPRSIENLGKSELMTPQTVHARVTEGTWGERSTTFANTLFYGERGANTFDVNSARHLYNIRHVPGGTYYQIQNIDMGKAAPNNIANFAPIGPGAFTGTYDAYQPGTAPYTISNLAVSHAGNNNIGLFANIGNTGTVQYLNLADVTISGAENVGAVAGQSSGAIVEVDVSGTVTGTADNAGGLVGLNDKVSDTIVGTISASSVTGTVNGMSDVGGMVGENEGTITASTSTANVTGTGTGTNVGGLVGLNSGELRTPRAEGITVTGDGTNIGGIAGFTNAEIQGAEVRGITVTGTGEHNINLGGIVGEAKGDDATIQNVVVSNTEIKGRTFLGGVAGRTNNAITEAAVENTEIIGTDSKIGGIVGEANGEKAEITAVTVTNAVVNALRTFGVGNHAGGVAGWTNAAITNATVSQTEILGRGEKHGGIVGEANGINAKISDVTVDNSSIKSARILVGGIAGLAEGDITDAEVKDTLIEGYGTGAMIDGIVSYESSEVGGIAGRSTAAIGDNDADDIKVTDVTVKGYQDYIGGVVGRITDATVKNAIVSSVTDGTSVEGRQFVGGIVGHAVGDVRIEDNAVQGTATVPVRVSARETYAGGVLGGGIDHTYADLDALTVTITAATVENATISGASQVGGVVGQFNPTETASAIGGAAPNGITVTNATVTGTGNQIGGVAGNSGGSITNATVEETEVSGNNSVGGVVGTTTGTTATVQNVLAIETEVSGNDSVGGIAGAVTANSTLQNATYLSAAKDAQITGTGANTNVGGIAGSNLSTVSDVLFLALAPKVGDTITPITANDANVTNAYYLKGKPIRPEEAEINPADPPSRDGYNLEEAVGPGEGHSTWALYEKFDNGYTLGDATTWGRNTLTPPTKEQAIKLENETYPYPYTTVPGASVLPANPGWPIAEEDVVFGGEGYYYELDTDDKYYVWNGKDRPDDGLDNDGKTLKEVGYVFFTEELIPDDAQLEVKRINDVDNWQGIGTLSPHTDSDALRTAANEPDTTAYVLPLELLTDRAVNLATPLEVRYTTNDGSTVLLNFYVHPFFAKAVYPRSQNTFDTFYIRTPWQMQNIGRLTTGDVNGPTKGKTFIQDRSFAVTVSNQQWKGVDADAAGSIANDTLVDGANADDTFVGHFIGTGFEITDLPFGKGLFATVGKDIGKVTGVTVKGHKSPASGNLIGTVAMKNEGLIENCLVEGSEFTLGVQASNVGFIVGENAGTITGCLVRGSSITNGSTGVGGVAGISSTMIQNSGVINSTIGGNDISIGGIVGTNTGTVQDVFFLSTITPKDIAEGKAPPVANSGGGIVGIQNGHAHLFTRALYLAPAPKVGTTIYPIARFGAPPTGDNFYLYGLKYRVMPGDGEWVKKADGTEEPYNDGTVQGGGEPMDTEGLDLVSLKYLENVYMPDEWVYGTGGYPYPIISGMASPTSWPETQNPDDYAQVELDELPYHEAHAKSLEFFNGEFGENYEPGKRNRVTDGESAPNGVWGNSNVHVYMESVKGWNTRPTENDPAKTSDGWRYAIELVDPRNGYGVMTNDYEGKAGGDSLISNPGGNTYAELNAGMSGTLYQSAATEPGQEFYYTFHHASRLRNESGSVTSATDTMNFFLSPVKDVTNTNPEGVPMAKPEDMVLIRPVASPRSQSNQGIVNPAAWDTVKYDMQTTEPMGAYWNARNGFPKTGGAFLYDVWIGDKAENGKGYGLTFWSTNNYNLNPTGYADETALRTAVGNDMNRVIGYWDIDYGWKQYYGSYTVPEGQHMTEFAYESTKLTGATIGNLLDGAGFQAAASLTIDEKLVIVNDGGSPVDPQRSWVDPEETVRVEMTVKAYGGLPATNVVVENRLAPFDAYLEYTGNLQSSVANVTSRYENGVVRINIPNGALPAPSSPTDVPSVTVSFDVKIRSKLFDTQSNAETDIDTLFYYIANQAVVRYNSFEKDQLFGNVTENAAPPRRLTIAELPMKKTIVDAIGNLVASPIGNLGAEFTVLLDISTDSPTIQNSGTRGLIYENLPEGFTLVEDSWRVSTNGGTSWAEASVIPPVGDSRRLTFRDVNFSPTSSQYQFQYKMKYEGDAFGVTYAGEESTYRFIYSDNRRITALRFEQPKLGIRVTAPDYAATVPLTANGVDFADGSNLYTRLPYAGVPVNPTIHFYSDENGRTEIIGTPISGGGIQFTHDGYTMLLVQPQEEYYLNFSFAAGDTGPHTLYYRIVANDEDGEFDLSSGIGKITLTVDPSAQAALPSPASPVLPPVAAATLGLMGVALGGGLGLKNGVSAAVTALLGAVSLLLVLTGLVLLPEKRRGQRRK